MQVILEGGIVGAGKTQAQRYLVKALETSGHAVQALSTDTIRKDLKEHLSWIDPFSHNERARTESDVAAIVGFGYKLMHTCVAYRDHNPHKVTKMLVRESPVPFIGDEFFLLQEYITTTMGAPADVIVCEAPYFPPRHLHFFHDSMLTYPIMLEVRADDALIRRRLERRSNDASKAGVLVYEWMKQHWQSMDQLGYHAHAIENNGTKAALKTTIDTVLETIRSCPDCPGARNL